MLHWYQGIQLLTALWNEGARSRWYQHPRWRHFYAGVNQTPPNIARRTKSTPNERRVPALPAIKNDITARDTCLPGCKTQSYRRYCLLFPRACFRRLPEKWRFVSASFSPVIYSRAALSAVVPILWRSRAGFKSSCLLAWEINRLENVD